MAYSTTAILTIKPQEMVGAAIGAFHLALWDSASTATMVGTTPRVPNPET